MKKVKMLKSSGDRGKGKVYDVTSRFANILIEGGFAVDPDAPKEVKENKEAKGRETKGKK